jgi:hypothetical protein
LKQGATTPSSFQSISFDDFGNVVFDGGSDDGNDDEDGFMYEVMSELFGDNQSPKPWQGKASKGKGNGKKRR